MRAILIAITVESIYRKIVLKPSLVSLFGSLIERVPDMIDTKINGNTIILSKLRKRRPTVSNIFDIKKSLITSSLERERLRIIPITTPAAIAMRIFLVKFIDKLS